MSFESETIDTTLYSIRYFVSVRADTPNNSQKMHRLSCSKRGAKDEIKRRTLRAFI